MTTPTKTILFTGGGTGGHIYPNIAIAQRLQELLPEVGCHFLVSNRPGDARIMAEQGFEYTAAPTLPLSKHPLKLAKAIAAIFAGKKQAAQLIRQHNIAALVATGGFVSGPAVLAAAASNIPVAMMNLDAVPGKANKRIAKYATSIFSAYRCDVLPGARTVGLPLRSQSLGPIVKQAARANLNLDPDKNTLLVVGGSTGASSINQAIPAMLENQSLAETMTDWQVLHITGARDEQSTREAYRGVASLCPGHPPVTVVGYCNRMGDAWAGANLAISRAGANSVAEAWTNHTPTIFMPYPYHKDEHQRLNAQPMVDTGGGVTITDRINPDANATDLADIIKPLITDSGRLGTMAKSLATHQPDDGALAVARWLVSQVSK